MLEGTKTQGCISHLTSQMRVLKSRGCPYQTGQQKRGLSPCLLAPSPIFLSDGSSKGVFSQPLSCLQQTFISKISGDALAERSEALECQGSVEPCRTSSVENRLQAKTPHFTEPETGIQRKADWVPATSQRQRCDQNRDLWVELRRNSYNSIYLLCFLTSYNPWFCLNIQSLL